MNVNSQEKYDLRKLNSHFDVSFDTQVFYDFVETEHSSQFQQPKSLVIRVLILQQILQNCIERKSRAEINPKYSGQIIQSNNFRTRDLNSSITYKNSSKSDQNINEKYRINKDINVFEKSWAEHKRPERNIKRNKEAVVSGKQDYNDIPILFERIVGVNNTSIFYFPLRSPLGVCYSLLSLFRGHPWRRRNFSRFWLKTCN